MIHEECGVFGVFSNTPYPVSKDVYYGLSAPGELLVFSEEGIKSLFAPVIPEEKKSCIFEYIYFARPDSVIDGVPVHEARTRAGRILAWQDAEKQISEPSRFFADVVIGVPDSGLVE